MKNIIASMIMILVIAGYFQHLVTTWQNDMLTLFIVGMFIPPIGVIHGILVLIGIF